MKASCLLLTVVVLVVSQAACNVTAGQEGAGITKPGPGQWRNSLRPKGQPAQELTLATDGKTDYVIVIPAKPTTQEQKAAEELAQWLKEMTGAAFPTTPDTAPRQAREISVGRTSRLAIVDIPAATKDLGDEGYAIAVQGQRLFLLGGRTRGPIYAVFALLEEDLGCRWYTSPRPGSSASINRIPNQPTLRFRPVPRSYVPVFDNREPYYAIAWDTTWSLRNRTNASNVGIPEKWGGTFNYALHAHSFGTLMPPSKYFKEHPEYFMLTDEGKRIAKQPCVTHPEVLKIITKNLLATLKKSPTAEIVIVSYNDGQGHCRCDNCMVLNEANNSPQGALLPFVNKVAEAAEKDYPNVLICTTAYNETMPAPTKVRARHNVAVRVCNSLHQWRYPLTDFTTSDMPLSRHYREEIIKWSKICKNIQVWDYCANFSHFLAPMPNMHTIGPAVRFYADHNVKGVFFQGIPRIRGGARAPLRVWVMAKVFWDPSRSVKELEQDFIWGTWGKVAPIIAEYNDLLVGLGDSVSGDVEGDEAYGSRYRMDAPFLTREFINKATVLFDRAEAMADDEKTRKRVERARLPIMYVKLMRKPAFTGEKYPELIERFAAVARREGISWLGMHSGRAKLDEGLDGWRKKWKKHQDRRKMEAVRNKANPYRQWVSETRDRWDAR